MLGVNIIKHRHTVLGRMNFSSPYVELPHRLSVRENLLVYARLYGVSQAARRVALAKALINEPDALLLDEPTASLDPDTADWVRGYLEQYQQNTGATILLASHNMTEVERLASG